MNDKLEIAKDEMNKERRKKRREEQYESSTLFYELQLNEEEAEVEDASRKRLKFYWGYREYNYTSGKPFDLVDMFEVGEKA